MLKTKNVDITGGPILKSIILYAVPIMIGTLIQVLFHASDLMVVSNVSKLLGQNGELATASVGAAGPVVSLLINSFVGLTVGTKVLLSRSLGERNDKRTNGIVNTSVLSGLGLGLVVCLAFIIFAPTLLTFTNCPDECFYGTVTYVRIYALGAPAVLVYNFSAAVITSTGDTQRPLFYLVISGITNVILNFILCFVLEQKVMAVAIATAISHLLSASLAVAHLMSLDGPCKLSIKNITFSIKEFGNILKVGLPAAINSALFSLSNMQVQTQINAYGPASTAASATSDSIESIASSISSSFSSSVIPFVGQNVGAHKPQRVKRAIICCAFLVFFSNLFIASVLFLSRGYLFKLYLPEGGEAITYATKKMMCSVLPFCIVALDSMFVGCMQALGHSLLPMLSSVVCILGWRVAWVSWIYPPLNEINYDIINLYLCYPTSWILSIISHSIMFSIIYRKYKLGLREIPPIKELSHT